MIPTFDFVNVIRELSKKVIKTAAMSPVPGIVIFLGALSAAFGLLWSHFSSNFLPDISVFLDIETYYTEKGWFQLVLWGCAGDRFINVLRYLFAFWNWLIPSVVAFAISLLSAHLIMRLDSVRRNRTKEIIT